MGRKNSTEEMARQFLGYFSKRKKMTDFNMGGFLQGLWSDSEVDEEGDNYGLIDLLTFVEDTYDVDFGALNFDQARTIFVTKSFIKNLHRTFPYQKIIDSIPY